MQYVASLVVVPTGSPPILLHPIIKVATAPSDFHKMEQKHAHRLCLRCFVSRESINARLQIIS